MYTNMWRENVKTIIGSIILFAVWGILIVLVMQTFSPIPDCFAEHGITNCPELSPWM